MNAQRLARQIHPRVLFAMTFLAIFQVAASCAQDTRDVNWRNTSEIEIYYRAQTGGRLMVFNLTRGFVYLEGSPSTS